LNPHPVAGFLNVTIDMPGAVHADGLEAAPVEYWNSAEFRGFRRKDGIAG